MKSKLLKLLAIPALALSLNSNKAEAQTRFQLQGDCAFRGGASYSTDKIVPYENWQGHFNKSKDKNFYLTDKYFFGKGDIDVSIDPTINFGGNFKIGATVEAPIISLGFKENLGKIFMHGWKSDSIDLQRNYMKQITPSLGGFIEFPVGWDGFLRLKATLQKYKFGQEKRQDEDYTLLKCEDIDYTADYTKIFEDKILRKGWTKRFSIDYKLEDEQQVFGVYYETDFDKFHEFGGKLGLYFSTGD